MSYAAPANRIVGDKRVQRALARQEERGKDPDITRILARHLSKGRGLTAQVVNKFNDNKYSDGRSTLPITFGGLSTDDDLDERFGRGSAANIAGLRGAEIGKGNIYMGATKVETPATSSRNVNSGYSSTPGSTRYDITVLPRWMVKGAGYGAASGEAASSGDDASSVTRFEPPQDLLAAREAYDRSNAYQAQGSGASFLPDLTKTGGELFNAIQGAAQDQIDDYERRFLPAIYANANLTAKEIGYATQNAIAGLPDDLALPDYNNMFPERAGKKGGLYKWLERRIK